MTPVLLKLRSGGLSEKLPEWANPHILDGMSPNHTLPKYIAGHAIRTTNQQEANSETAQIGKLWQKVTADEALLSVPDRIDARLYAVLFDYETDEKGAYTQIVGVGVNSPEGLPRECESVELRDVPRKPYGVTGEMPLALIRTWEQIWEETSGGSLHRAFTQDVEVHREDGSAEILIAVAE